MKTMQRWMAAVAMVAAVQGLCVAEQLVQTQVTVLDIQGMKAGSAAQVEKALTALPGVSTVKADEQAGVAVVIFDPVKVKMDELTQAVRQAGYLAQFADARFQCSHCGAKYSKDGTCIVCGVPLEPATQA